MSQVDFTGLNLFVSPIVTFLLSSPAFSGDPNDWNCVNKNGQQGELLLQKSHYEQQTWTGQTSPYSAVLCCCTLFYLCHFKYTDYTTPSRVWVWCFISISAVKICIHTSTKVKRWKTSWTCFVNDEENHHSQQTNTWNNGAAINKHNQWCASSSTASQNRMARSNEWYINWKHSGMLTVSVCASTNQNPLCMMTSVVRQVLYLLHWVVLFVKMQNAAPEYKHTAGSHVHAFMSSHEQHQNFGPFLFYSTPVSLPWSIGLKMSEYNLGTRLPQHFNTQSHSPLVQSQDFRLSLSHPICSVLWQCYVVLRTNYCLSCFLKALCLFPVTP